jgi:hypothetical protein
MRLALAAVLAAAALAVVALASEAAGDGLSLSVHAGYQDVVKLGEWVPVIIDVRNSGAGIDGRLEVQESLNAQPGVTGFTIYEQPIGLATGASKRVRIFLVEDTVGVTVTARIVQNGRVIASQNATTGNSTSTLIGVLSDQPAALDEIAAVHPGGIAARVVHLRPEDISESAIPMRAFDILAIDDFATDGLTAGQRGAIADYVQAGGDLLLGTGAAWRKTLAGLPSSILPMEPTGTVTIHSAAALGHRDVEVAVGVSRAGRDWLSEGAQPLLLERPVGSGSVTMAAFDWAQDPVDGWEGTKDLLRQVMARTVFGHASSGSQAQIMYGIGGAGPAIGGFYGGGQPSVASKSNALTSVLSNLPSLDLPSLQLTGALVLLYVLLVGPINYVVLGAMRRRALSWITVPLIALLAASGAYGAGILTKGRSVQTNQVAIVHLAPGWERAYQETYTGVIPPSRGDYEARIAGEHMLISPIATGNGLGNGAGMRVNVATSQVALTGMTAFAFGGFATETVTAAPQLTGRLQLVNGRLVGTIENTSNLTFTDAVFVFGDSYQTFGTLRPGGKAAVNLAPKIATNFGNPSYMQIYTPNGYPGGGGSVTDRDNFAKSQVLSLLPTGTSLKGITLAATPLFVAWTHQSFQDVTVNGSHPRSTSLTAVALSLSVDQIGTGTLPAGVLNGRIVDVVGDSQGQTGIPGTFTMQSGSLTYEFAPLLAPGTRLTGVSVNSQNPFNPRGAPGTVGQSGPTIAGEVWDWSRSAWTDIAYQDNGTTALPDGAVHPASGLVRLRLTTTNGATLSGNLTLSGTVR